MSIRYIGSFERLLGDKGLHGTSLIEKQDDTIHFLVTDEKQPNYHKYCNRIEPALNPIATINEYTNHPTEHYAKVNLALASDSSTLEKYSNYIPQLKSSILAKPLFDDGIVYRGVELSSKEIEQMERLKSFFIPSFTSTSIDSQKAYQKSSMMVIKLPYACSYACSITQDLSKYYNDEREVLLSCYSAFHLERIEYVNNKHIVSLYLDEHLSALSNLK